MLSERDAARIITEHGAILRRWTPTELDVACAATTRLDDGTVVPLTLLDTIPNDRTAYALYRWLGY